VTELADVLVRSVAGVVVSDWKWRSGGGAKEIRFIWRELIANVCCPVYVVLLYAWWCWMLFSVCVACCGVRVF
jgi:hypothetical protein